MPKNFYYLIKQTIWYLAALLILSACTQGGPAPVTSPVTSTSTEPPVAEEEASPTPLEPSPTPAPLALRVGPVEIYLEDYQSELSRYQAAVNRELTEQDQQQVLDELIDQALLARAAIESGFSVDDAAVQERVDRLAQRAGGVASLETWLSANEYTEAGFRRDLARQMAAAWMRDQILDQVPQTAEQVHARQILVATQEEANQVIGRLQAGQDFAVIADEYNPTTGGELGWFPWGYLPEPAIEEAAFALQPGEWSQPVETATGFHILQVIEREPERALDPAASLALEARALQDWLAQQRSEQKVEVLLSP